MLYNTFFSRTTCVLFIIFFVLVSLTACTKKKEAVVKTQKDAIIVDTLNRCENYYDMHPAFSKAFAFLRQNTLADLPPGRHDIEGDQIYCIIVKGPGRTREEAKLESHRKYIDIQYVINGADEMGWKPTKFCSMVQEHYDPEKDIKFFNDEPEVWAKVQPGSFAIFLPKDAHAPMVGDGEIHKAVLKIAVDYTR